MVNIDKKSIVIAEYLGFKVCTKQDQIEFCGVKTIERLDRLTDLYKPLFIKDKDYLFPDTYESYLYDWVKIMKIAGMLGILEITTNKEQAIDRIYMCIESKRLFN